MNNNNHIKAIAKSKQMLEQPMRWFGASLFVVLMAVLLLAPKPFIDIWYGLLVIVVGLVVSYANPLTPLLQRRWLSWVFAHVHDLPRLEKEAFRRGWLKNKGLVKFTNNPRLTQQLAMPTTTLGELPRLPETSAFYFNLDRLNWWKDQTVLIFGLLFGVAGIAMLMAGQPVVVGVFLLLTPLGVIWVKANQNEQFRKTEEIPLQISKKGIRVYLDDSLCSLGWNEVKYALVHKDTLKLVFFAEQQRNTMHLTLARLVVPAPETLQQLLDNYQTYYWQQQRKITS